MPDFRAAERTAALLVQLAGRAGRGLVPGRVFVQTWKPDHYVLQHLHSLEGFYDTELRLRSTMRRMAAPWLAILSTHLRLGS